jgi:MFS family permease
MPDSARATDSSVTDTAYPLATGWRMWVPVVAMMTCSWLSYIDRQALAVISPMILKDTGLSAASYADAVSVFSVVYMISNPLWGSLLDYAPRRNVRSGRNLEHCERVARVGRGVSRFCSCARAAGFWRRRHVSWRPQNSR